jgi:hypothetical protein
MNAVVPKDLHPNDLFKDRRPYYYAEIAKIRQG